MSIKVLLNFITMFLLVGIMPLINQAEKVDYEKSKVSFSIDHVGKTAHGVFEKFVVEKLVFDPNELANVHLEATIDASSINTGINMRDNVLRGKSHFNVEEYATLHFVSRSVSKNADGSFTAKGQLTIKGTTKEVNLKFQYQKGYFKATLPLNRRDYGVGDKSWLLKDDLVANIEISIQGD